MVGNYYEPDFNDLGEKMSAVYRKYERYKVFSLVESEQIRQEFNWERIAKIGLETIDDFLKRKGNLTKKKLQKNKIIISYIDGPFVEIKEDGHFLYNVQFINKHNNKLEFETDLKSNQWAKASKKYYINWLIKITGIDNDFYYEHHFNLENQKVYVALDSKSLGDSLAWIPYVEEFRKVHNCKMVVSTFMNEMFENQYPNIEFIKPGRNIETVYASYSIGLYYNEDSSINLFKNPIDPKKVTLQKICSDILGLPYKEIKPKLKQTISNIDKKYNQVCIGIHGTAQSKYWNNKNGWQDVVDWLNSKGYVVKLISREDNGYMGNVHPNGIVKHPNGPIELVMDELKKSKAFIGIGSGLSWLSWALDVPTVIISGFSYSWAEMEDCIRIAAPKGKCEGCFNRLRLDAGDWNWCPDHKGTKKQFECTKSITSEMVIKELEKFL
jgi:autotransporter strand-loop-strand O-heptosyltransferase